MKMTWKNIKRKCGTHVLEDMHGQKEINEVGTFNVGVNSAWLVWEKRGVKMLFIRFKIDDPLADHRTLLNIYPSISLECCKGYQMNLIMFY